ncbi:HlyD family type I secretion periplasmic adaptor subunit [Terrihabitans sp. B22-R8]|uniref:HlyD family type I secretion periplasmic adaptor subunit n=1 Tax=Terrihabitans sp. B22-R8 TaxID=3425128 RepID=UPI00403C2D57
MMRLLTQKASAISVPAAREEVAKIPDRLIELSSHLVTRLGQLAEPEQGDAPTAPTSIRGPVVVGSAIVFVAFFGFGLWAAIAPLAGAVAASATLAVEGQRRAVQHLEGGIVRQIAVHEGDLVNQGDVLIRLDRIAPTAQVQRLRTQLDMQTALQSRLLAERSGALMLTFPPELLQRAANDADVAAILQGQRQQFDERRATLQGQIAILHQRIKQLQSQVRGHEQQQVANSSQVRLLQDELGALLPLLERGLVSKPRVFVLQREVARLEGIMATTGTSIAVAQQSIGEAELQITHTRQQRLDEVTVMLREAEAQIADLGQQYHVAQDIMKRLDITAPQTGVVQNVRVTTEGGVISPGETLMEIAPSSDKLLIQARVSPNDVSHVSVGQEAEVRFIGLDLRRTPEIIGTVITLSGDRLVDQATGTPYFLAQVQTGPAEMEKLAGQRIHAGMPAEVFIQTGKRTLLQYLTKPLTDAVARGLNER